MMSDLNRRVLDEIARRGLKPRPLWHFLARRSVFWTLAAASVALGSAAVALTLFLVRDAWNTGGRGFDEMPLDDLAPFLPLAATALVALAIASATVGYRQTRHGYRARPLVAAAVIAGLVFAFGTGLHLAGAGGRLHRALADRLPAYAAWTTIPYAHWSQPDAGRLGGAALEVLPDGQLRLRDFAGQDWTVDLRGATVTFGDDPVAEGDIAVTGTRTGPATFRARRVEAFD